MNVVLYMYQYNLIYKYVFDKMILLFFIYLVYVQRNLQIFIFFFQGLKFKICYIKIVLICLIENFNVVYYYIIKIVCDLFFKFIKFIFFVVFFKIVYNYLGIIQILEKYCILF